MTVETYDQTSQINDVLIYNVYQCWSLEPSLSAASFMKSLICFRSNFFSLTGIFETLMNIAKFRHLHIDKDTQFIQSPNRLEEASNLLED